MNTLDWVVIATYMAAMIGFSIYLGRGQASQDDYYVGGRNLPWWAVGVSTMATQTSAVSFISVPAFVGLREAGGLTILQNELAVPLAMIFIMIFLIPLFRRLELISIYEYLELRFGRGTRLLLAAVFLLSRGLATGVGVYASAIVLAVCLGTDLWIMILAIGIITIIYDTIGGIKAVVYSDVIQMVILLAGIGLCVVYALEAAGGWDRALAAFDPARFRALELTVGLGEEGTHYPFWGFFVGGFFLYASYYGCDQSQAQRELSAPSTAHTKYSLIFNGFARLPLSVAYVIMGLAVGGAFLLDDGSQDLLAGNPPDYMVPLFVLHYLPHGIKALIFAAILAAAMSSLDSALNSLSASTMQDFIERHLPEGKPRTHLVASKVTTVVWGVAIVAIAFRFGGQETVVETINKIGSAFYGPILAAFVVGVMFRRVSGFAVVAGILAGVGVNLVLWQAAPAVFWMWWNATGCVVAVAVALVASLAVPQRPRKGLDELVVWGSGMWSRERPWLPIYAGLGAYFVLMLLLCWQLPRWLTP